MNIIKRTVLTVLILLVSAWLVSLAKLHFLADQYAPVSDAQLLQAKRYLGHQITPVPSSFKWSMFKTQAGVTLRTGLLEHDEPKGTVIVVPGFTGSIEMIMREIVMIHAAGYRVATLEYRGQGLSHRPLPNHPERGYVEGYGLLGDEVAQYAKQVKQTGLPLFFYSISKGAHITMRMAAEHQLGVNAYALIVPMIQVNSGEVAYDTLQTVAKFMSSVGLGAIYSPGASTWPGGELVFGKVGPCNSNPKTAQTQSALFAMNKKLRTRGVTFKWLYETTKSSEKLLHPEFVQSIKSPVKIYTAGIDSLVRTDKTEQFCDSLSDCQIRHYPDSRHCITREDYKLYDTIIADAIIHFDNNVTVE